jgi:hypothetical protein
MKEWWTRVERPRRIMLGAILMLFVSQFLPYGEKQRFYLTNLDRDFYTGNTSEDVAATGWELHPMALPIIALLAIGFATGLATRPGIVRWSYWIAAGSFLLTMTPATPMRAIGAMVGIASLGVAIWAAVAARKSPA